jgi:hypothetical protein
VRAGVPGLVPGDLKMVLYPRYTIGWSIYIRARPLLTCIIPKHEGKGLHPGREQGKPRVPEKEAPINPINPRGELALLAPPQGEIRAFLAQSSSA